LADDLSNILELTVLKNFKKALRIRSMLFTTHVRNFQN